MTFSFFLPLIGAGIGAALTRRKTFDRKPDLVFVNDEIPINDISDDLVRTTNGITFKVIRFSGRCVAGKRFDELESDLSKLRTFFMRLNEFDVEIRIYSQRFEKAENPIKFCGNPFLDEITSRWEHRLKRTFDITHYMIVQTAEGSDENDRVIKEVKTLLSDFKPTVLSGNDLTAFLSTFYNPTPQKELAASRITILKNGEIVFQTNGWETHRLIFGIRSFGSNVSGQIIENLLALPYSMTLTTHLKPIGKTQALTDIKNRDIQANFLRKPENQTDKFLEIRTAIEDDTETLLTTEMTVHLNIETNGSKETAIESILGCLGNFGVRPVLERQFALPMFWGQCPGRDIFNRELRLTASNVADLHPLIRCETGLERCDWGECPVCRFPTAPAGNPFGFTFHATPEDQAPPHCVVFAPTGSGKSVLMLHLMTESLASYPDLSVFALDRDNGLTVYTEMAGGTYHQLSKSGNICLNPFDCDASDETNLILFLKILTNAETDEEEKDIRLFVSEIMKQPRINRRMNVYYNELVPVGKFKGKLEKWVSGNTLNAKLFNGEKDTLDMTKKRLNVFGVDNIKDDPAACAAFFFYLFKRIEQNAQTGKPSLLIVDEAPTLLSAPALKEMIEKLLKTARKQRTAVFMAFQGTADLNSLGLKETILTNCHTRFFYSGAASCAEELSGFSLTESETDFVLTKGKSIKGAKRPILMQRSGTNVFLDTDMSCLGEYLNAYKGGAKTVHLMNEAKKLKRKDWIAYYLKHYGEEQ